MAETGEAESLVRKEPDTPAHDPIVGRSTSGIMLICALLLTISLGWALYDEALGQRPWKGIQKQFVSRYTRYLKSIKPQAGNTETKVKETPDYQALEAEAYCAVLVKRAKGHCGSICVRRNAANPVQTWRAERIPRCLPAAKQTLR